MATTASFMVTDTLNSSSTVDPEYYSDDHNIQDETCDTSDEMQFGTIFTSVFYPVVVVFSLFGNILIIVILAKFENLRSLTNAFIMNLAISDLLFTTSLPFWTYYYIYGWTFGDPACKIVSFIFSVGFYSSGILLIMMTAHRYVAVMNPLSDLMSTSGFYSALATVVFWVASFLIASPVLFSRVQNQNNCVYANSSWSLWGIYQQNALFVVSSAVFVFCYSQIIRRLLRPTGQRRKSKTIKLIFALMLVFFVGWAPYNAVIFLQSLYFWPQEEADPASLAAKCNFYKPLERAFYISRIFAFSHCCLNPVFYVFVGVKFKNHTKKLLQSWRRSNSGVRSRQSRLTITSVTSGEEFSV